MTDSAAPRALLEQRLGLPIEPSLLECALTHRSFSFENGECPNNERLEFLGDSVLGLVVTDTLYVGYPNLPEGQLAKFRSHVVNSRALAQVARGLELGRFLRLGKGEENTNGRDKSSILADTVEALIGAVYLDHDLETAGELIHRLFGPLPLPETARIYRKPWHRVGLIGVALIHQHQLVRIAIRQRLEQHAAHHREQCHIGPNAQRQHHHGH